MIILISCNENSSIYEDLDDRAYRDSVVISNYILSNQIEASYLGRGIYYTSFEYGNGNFIDEHDSIVLDYTGRILYGEIFDNSYYKGEKFSFELNSNEVIEGWEIIIRLMREGDSSRCYIPSHLAYGTNGIESVIPPNSCLIFDIKIHEVHKKESP